MSTLLRSILLASFMGALLVGCGAAEDVAETATDAADAATEMASDAADTATEAASDMADAVASGPGGYEPTDDERIPGITE